MSEDFNSVTGLDFIGLVDDSYVINLDVLPRHHNVRGIVHGGVLCTLLDTAMTRAFLHLLPKEQQQGVTLEMNVNFLKATSSGKLTAYGKLINSTRRTAYVEGAVENEAGHLVAKSSATIILLDPSHSKNTN